MASTVPKRTMLRNISGALVQPVHHALGVDKHVAQGVQHLTRSVHRHGFVLRLVFKRLPLFEPAHQMPSGQESMRTAAGVPVRDLVTCAHESHAVHGGHDRLSHVAIHASEMP